LSKRADILYVIAKDPTRQDIWTWSRELKEVHSEPRVVPPRLRVDENADELNVANAAVKLSISKRTAMLNRLLIHGREVPLSDGPRFIAYRRNDRKYDEISGSGRVTHLETRKEGNALVVEASLDGALRTVRWRFLAEGESAIKAQLEYEYSFAGAADILGIRFSSSAEQIRSLRWLGMGPYRVWQNRLEGTRLDVWENSYNDSTPGETWDFPEFKGYFRDLHWVRFDARNGPFTLSTSGARPYLGLFKPKDGVNGLLDLPDVGIAVLDVIPAMRNKFHTTDEIGPQSKAKEVLGLVKRSIQFSFGR
jgi:hypothetical protein